MAKITRPIGQGHEATDTYIPVEGRAKAAEGTGLGVFGTEASTIDIEPQKNAVGQNPHEEKHQDAQTLQCATAIKDQGHCRKDLYRGQDQGYPIRKPLGKNTKGVNHHGKGRRIHELDDPRPEKNSRDEISQSAVNP